MKSLRFLPCLLFSVAAAAATPSPGVPADARWSSSDQWAEWKDAGHTVRNNIWGEKPGAQTVWAVSAAHYGVWADHPGTGGIKSYPHSEKAVHRPLSALTRCTTRFACVVPAAGAYNTAYDIWCEKHAYEIMVWVNWTGPVAPITAHWSREGKPIPDFKSVTVGGHTWDVFKGTNGYNQVYSFLRTDPATAGEIDVKELLLWVKQAGWFDGKDVALDEIQFGWEITSSPGGLNFEVTDFSADVE